MFPLTCPNFCTPAEAITTSPIRLQRQSHHRLRELGEKVGVAFSGPLELNP